MPLLSFTASLFQRALLADVRYSFTSLEVPFLWICIRITWSIFLNDGQGSYPINSSIRFVSVRFRYWCILIFHSRFKHIVRVENNI